MTSETVFANASLILRDRVARVLPHWRGAPGQGFMLGMHAFGLEETGLYDRAEQAGRRAIELEPRYERIDPDGGWAAVVTDLEVVHLEGDHLAMVDEPVVGTVGKHLARRLTELDAGVRKGTDA